MNVLVLEDRGASAYYVLGWLRENGHRVLDAFNPNDAQSHWDKRDKVPLDCILLDLNTPTDGLSEEQKTRTEGGLLSGWVWLYDSVLRETPEMRQRIIIYSDYTATLKENVPESEYGDIARIPKRQRSSSAREVVARIHEIAQMTRETSNELPSEGNP